MRLRKTGRGRIIYDGIEHEPAKILYIVGVGDNVGFGITRNIQQRVIAHRFYCRRAKLKFHLQQTFHFENGAEAQLVENYLRRLFRAQIIDAGIPGFRREALPLRFSSKLLSSINKAITC